MDETIMQSSLEQFFQMASQDQELQSKLKAASDHEAYIRSCVELGKEKGYSFTSDQVMSALDAAAKEAAENLMAEGELSESELNAVAGGRVDPNATRVHCQNCFSSKPAPVCMHTFPIPPRGR